MNHFGLGLDDHIRAGFNVGYDIKAWVLDGDDLYVGGDFTTYKGIQLQCIAKIKLSTGDLDPTFDSTQGTNGTVDALALDGIGNLYIGGEFTTYKGTARQYIAKISALTATLDATFNSANGFDSSVSALVVDRDTGGLYCGGWFSSYKGTPRQRIAKIDLSNASLDTNFNSAHGFDGYLTSLILNAGYLYCGGGFNAYKGTPRYYIAKINASTAALNFTFNPSYAGIYDGFNGFVYSLELDGDYLSCSGQFSTYNGTTRQGVAKLNIHNAALDTTNSENGHASEYDPSQVIVPLTRITKHHLETMVLNFLKKDITLWLIVPLKDERIQDYFENGNHQEEYEQLVKWADDRNEFLSLASDIAKTIDPNLTPDLLYDYLDAEIHLEKLYKAAGSDASKIKQVHQGDLADLYN